MGTNELACFMLEDAVLDPNAMSSKALEKGMSQREFEDLWVQNCIWKSSVAAEAIAAAFDLSRFKTACDLGGKNILI